MKILSIIPARKGSKDIKNKNLVKFKGKPLIFHSIRVSKKIKSITTFVSTDSKKILQYAKKKGIQFNYLRPKFLAKDKSNVIDAVFHALKWFKERKVNFDAILLLQPTSPLRKESDVIKMIKIFKKKNMQSIMSVSKAREHPFKLIKINKRKWNFLEKNKKNFFNRQQYPQNYFVEDGNIYLAKISFLKRYKSFSVINKTNLYKLYHYPYIDINNHTDLKIAKLF